ncbi:unnamed protein product [Schistosoma haematobium]|nr:unnamed protein product [Schistosoma haematobium]
MNEPWNLFNTSPGSPTQPISKRQYRLAHQTLCITHIDFEQRLIVGFTQLVIWPITPTLRRIHINCRQCRIHRILLEAADNESAEFESDRKGRSSSWGISKTKLIPSPTDLPILYTDPTLEICERDIKLRTLDSFERRYTSVVMSTDPDEDAGEVTVRLPSDFWPLISQKSPFILTIEFSLNKPKSGFYFVVPDGEGSLSERGVHAFTAFTPNCSRLWFPCIDCSEPCTWKIEVTVFEDLVAVAPGELIDAPYYTEDLTHKTYHFYVSQPVSAPCIGLAVGAFEIFPDPRLSNGATHFCPNGLLNLLQYTISPLSEMIEYYESILASQYPFSTIKCVFVDCAFSKCQSFASLIILSLDLLHSPRVIDQAIETRKILSLAVAHQFFGCFLIMETWCDAWLTYGLAGYLSGLYQKRVFGNNEYRKIVLDEMHFVTEFENMRYGIVLDPSKLTSKLTYFDLSSSHLISPDYLSAYKKKSHLVIRMLELRLGQPVLLQVLNKLLVLARLSTKSILSSTDRNQSLSVGLDGCGRNEGDSVSVTSNTQPQQNPTVPPCMSGEHRANILLSTASFRRIISMVTGQDIRNFLNQWACHAGHVRIFAKFHFNRKRNVVELELKQRAMVKALSTLRVQQVCPHDILIFISDLLRHNDNSRNPYSDSYYLADLVKAMKDTLTPAIIVRGVMSASTLPFEARTVIEEVSHLLNLETETISYKGTVTVVCLAAIRRLQRLGFLPIDPSLFYQYALSNFYCDIRVAAIEAVVDYIRGERDQSALDWLFSNIIEREDASDASYVRLRFEAVQLLLRMPPFQRGESGSRLDTPQLVERLWTLMNYGCTGDPRLRCAVAELYYTLYGNRRPTCLPLPEGVLLVRVKEGRSVLNISENNSKASEIDYTDELNKYKSECFGRGIPLSKMHPEYEELEDNYSECEMLHANTMKLERDSIQRPTVSEFNPQFDLKRSRIGNFSELNDSSNTFKRRTERLSDDEDD